MEPASSCSPQKHGHPGDIVTEDKMELTVPFNLIYLNHKLTGLLMRSNIFFKEVFP